MRVLFLADCPPIGPVTTGFGRVAAHIGKALTEAGAEVVQVAINHRSGTPPYPWQFRPTNDRDKLGCHGLIQAVRQEDWDLILGFHDLWVCNLWYLLAKAVRQQHDKPLIPFYGYFPVDALAYGADLTRWLPEWAGAATYSEFGRQVIRDAGYDGPLEVIPHGVDTLPAPTSDIRATLPQRFQDSWIVFRHDVNRPRKRYDLAIQAFVEFAKDKPLPPDPKAPILWLHTGDPGDCLPVRAYYERCLNATGYAFDQRPLLLTHGSKPGQHPYADEQTISNILAGVDCYLQTSDAEGWGLCPVEAAAAGCPVIVGRHSVHTELWTGAAAMVEPVGHQGYAFDIPSPIGGEPSKTVVQYPVLLARDYAAALESVYAYPAAANRRAARAKARFTSPRFQWGRIETQFQHWMGLGVLAEA